MCCEKSPPTVGEFETNIGKRSGNVDAKSSNLENKVGRQGRPSSVSVAFLGFLEFMAMFVLTVCVSKYM